MKRILFPLAAAVLSLSAAVPAAAQQSAADYFRERAASPNIPQVLSDADRQFYTKVFAALEAGNWSEVESLLSQRPDEPLKLVAQAEYYLDANSPRIELPTLQQWLANGSRLPQAQQITDLALKRGLMSAPYLPPEQGFVPQGYASKRILPRDIDDGTMPRDIRAAILDRISNDDPDGARVLLDGVDAGLSSEARAEWRRRVAWSYYIENDDAAALAMARTVRDGSGPWVPEGDWVVGIAAWRMNDCATAAEGFDRAAASAINPELSAASYYWAHRAYVRCRQPEKAAEKLRGAAMMDETLYGMLAREQLGQLLPRAGETPDLDEADWRMLNGEANVRVAVALAQIGQDDLADEVLRHQARIGDPAQFTALSRLARELGLPETHSGFECTSSTRSGA